ncbi:MAG: VirB3 family type IV secretion system protein [Acidobacteriia bacterium]|nr:VirB3 family type IV secretion system protein [Terriglobia bacterium]
MESKRLNPVYRAINRPLTILGAERRLFFAALVLGGAVFNLFGSVFSGIVMFAALLIPARWATHSDAQMLRILLNSGKFRKQYDPLKFCDQTTKVISHA